MPALSLEAAKGYFANDFRGHKAYLFERDIYTEKFISAADAQQVRSPLFKAI
ncbi:Phenol hydroxylase P5 protein [compost metagenome]